MPPTRQPNARPNSLTRKSILIVDDHELIRSSMAEVLRRAFDAADVIEASRFDEAIERIADPAVFLAVMDLTMPGLESPRDLEKLRRLRPDVRVVVLSGSSNRADILAALEAGVHGYIVKSERTERVIGHIKRVLDGEIYVPPLLADLNSQSPAPRNKLAATLSGRQREVLTGIVDGLSNKEIGRQLDLANGTVKLHVSGTLRALGVKTRAQAAAIGRKILDGSGSGA